MSFLRRGLIDLPLSAESAIHQMFSCCPALNQVPVVDSCHSVASYTRLVILHIGLRNYEYHLIELDHCLPVDYFADSLVPVEGYFE